MTFVFLCTDVIHRSSVAHLDCTMLMVWSPHPPSVEAMGLFAMSKKCFDRSSTVEKDFPKQSNITPSRTLQQHGCASRMSLRRCSRISQHTYNTLATKRMPQQDRPKLVAFRAIVPGIKDFHYLLCSHCFQNRKDHHVSQAPTAAIGYRRWNWKGDGQDDDKDQLQE